MDADFEAEQLEVSKGLGRAENSVPIPDRLRLKQSVINFNFGETLAALDVDNVPFKNKKDDDRFGIKCRSAKTTLLASFSFWPDIDLEPPIFLVRELLQRSVLVEQEMLPLWEKSFSLPTETAELSQHFRQLVGYKAEEGSPMHRLRVPDKVREYLFRDARLWAYIEKGECSGKRCKWEDVSLLIFPHGSILSITVDWMSEDAPFTLFDLRNWLYIAKFKSIKVGVNRGWSFGQRVSLNETEEEKRCFGLKMYAALFGYSNISFASIANWLVKLPSEPSNAIISRVSRYGYCLHHTCVLIEKKPESEHVLQEYMFHIRRAHKIRNQHFCKEKDVSSSDQVITLKENIVVGLSREGVFGLVWDVRNKKTFFKQFFGIFKLLSLHCLSERVTLEKLLFLAALQSQNLPGSGASGKLDLRKKEMNRREIVDLAVMLVKYRSCMSSEDCGGRPLLGEYFHILRHLYAISNLKRELGESVQDMLAIVNRDWNEERQKAKRKEVYWKLKRDEIAKQLSTATSKLQMKFDIASNGFIGVTFPMVLFINLFAMNVNNTPTYTSWAGVTVAGILVGIIFVGIFVVIYLRGKAQVDAVTQEKRELIKKRLEEEEEEQLLEEDELELHREALYMDLPPSSHEKREKGSWKSWFSSKLLTNSVDTSELWTPLATDKRKRSAQRSVYHQSFQAPIFGVSSMNVDGEEEEEDEVGGEERDSQQQYLTPSSRGFSIDLPRSSQSEPVLLQSSTNLVLPKQDNFSIDIPRVLDDHFETTDEDRTMDYMSPSRREFSIDLGPRPLKKM